MQTHDSTSMTSTRAAAHETLVANLRNAHALEKQVLAVLQPQLEVLTPYPDMHARVTQHIGETREQARRLQGALEACGSSTSMVKDAFLSVMGFGQSSVQGFSDDAVLKAVVADMLTEQLEIATYRSLIVLAEMAGKPEIKPALEASLREEEAMADWLNQNLETITRRFVEIKADQIDQAAASGHADESATDSPTQLPPETLHGTAGTLASDDRAPLGMQGMGQGERSTRPGDL